VTTLGKTFTSGSVYLSIQSLSAYYDGFGYTVGPNFSDFILTLKSEDVSTQCKGNKIATSINWADLNWPVPASAYECQDRCARVHVGLSTPVECSTIWSDVNPLLAIPTKVKDLSPLWSTCLFDVPLLANYWFDPPLALQEHTVADSITKPVAVVPTPTPAEPQSLPAYAPALATSNAPESPIQTFPSEYHDADLSSPSGKGSSANGAAISASANLDVDAGLPTSVFDPAEAQNGHNETNDAEAALGALAILTAALSPAQHTNGETIDPSGDALPGSENYYPPYSSIAGSTSASTVDANGDGGAGAPGFASTVASDAPRLIRFYGVMVVFGVVACAWGVI
jgi:hypothetical protein